MTLSSEQGAHLVSIARRTVELVVVEAKVPGSGDLPPWAEKEGAFLKVHRGAFVTLTDRYGSLRGCIGVPYPVKPLWEAVVHASVGAATHDPRFPRVRPEELESLGVEVSAMTEPETILCKAVELPKHVVVGRDGLIVSGMGTSGLLLPQVATEMGLGPDGFLSLTCQKAGLLPDAWLRPGVQVKRFQAEVFSEQQGGRGHSVRG